MVDVETWRRRIGGFSGGGRRKFWKWDPYGGGDRLTFIEVLFCGLCFGAAVLCGYAFLEEDYQAELRGFVKCQSVGENQEWRRRRGWYCEEDFVTGLTFGGAVTVLMFSVWGVHELFRRLRVLLSKDLEKNPGPAPKSRSRSTPRKAGTSQQEPKTSKPPTISAKQMAAGSGAGVFTPEVGVYSIFTRAAEGERRRGSLSSGCDNTATGPTSSSTEASSQSQTDPRPRMQTESCSASGPGTGNDETEISGAVDTQSSVSTGGKTHATQKTCVTSDAGLDAGTEKTGEGDGDGGGGDTDTPQASVGTADRGEGRFDSESGLCVDTALFEDGKKKKTELVKKHQKNVKANQSVKRTLLKFLPLH